MEPRALVGEGHLPLLLEGGRLEKQRAVDRLLQGHEVLHFLEGMEMGLHRHTGTPDAVEIARMVGMGVGEHDAHAVPGAAEGREGVIESSLAVGVVEAHVHDDGLSPASQYEVGVDSLERIGRQGHFHQIQIGKHRHRLAEAGPLVAVVEVDDQGIEVGHGDVPIVSRCRRASRRTPHRGRRRFSWPARHRGS